METMFSGLKQESSSLWLRTFQDISSKTVMTRWLVQQHSTIYFSYWIIQYICTYIGMYTWRPCKQYNINTHERTTYTCAFMDSKNPWEVTSSEKLRLILSSGALRTHVLLCLPLPVPVIDTMLLPNISKWQDGILNDLLLLLCVGVDCFVAISPVCVHSVTNYALDAILPDWVVEEVCNLV